MRNFVVAIVGATGAVGREMAQVLHERAFPIAELRAFASSRSVGEEIVCGAHRAPVRVLDGSGFEGVDFALFSAGAERSRAFAPAAAAAGAVVIDNSSAFRMDPSVPLVVPEVNPDAARAHHGIIANPNCSTIQMVVALQPLRTLYGLRRIVVATYQSVSGAGARAMRELERQSRDYLAGAKETIEVFPHSMAFDVMPQIDVFDAQGETREEIKMRQETRKIFSMPDLDVHATCVRVPVFRGHSEAVWAETVRPVDHAVLAQAMARAPGVVFAAQPDAYPMARRTSGRDAVFVGRLRGDPADPHRIAMWVVADNLRKGAATNAVQIAETLVAVAAGEAGR